MKRALAIILAGLTVLASVPASAFTPEGVQKAAEISDSGASASLSATVTVPAEYSAAYGQLVWFSDFSGTAYAKNLTDLVLPSYGYQETETFQEYSTLKCGQSDIDPYSVGVEVKPSGETWQYIDGTAMTGKATMYAEIYVDNDSAPARYTVAAPGSGWGGYYTSWTCTGKPGAKAWSTTYSSAVNLSSYTRFGLLSGGWNNEHVRALAIYVMPDNALWLTSDSTGANRSYVTVPGTTYTFPTTFNSAAVEKWTDGTTTYDAGASAAIADVAAKTFYPYVSTKAAEAPAAYDAARGQLVWFSNFSGTDYADNLTELVLPSYQYQETEKFLDYYTLKCGQSDIDPKTPGVEVKPAGTTWQYTDGTVMTGKATMYAEIYVDADSAPGRYSVAAPGSDWGGYWTSWTCSGKPGSRAWSTTYSSAVNLAYYTRFGLLSDNWKNEHVRALAIYVMPDNALWLTSDDAGSDRSYVTVADTTYTFPATYQGATVEKWTDGTVLYAAGVTVAIADVAAKTFYPFVNVYADAPASYDETLGQLIYFTNFGPETYDSEALLFPKDAAAGKVIDGLYGALGTDPTYNSTGIVLVSADGEGNVWKYKDGTTVAGTMTIKGRAVSEEASRSLYDVHDPANGGDSFVGLYTNWNSTGVSSGWANTKFPSITSDSFKAAGFRSNMWNGKVYYAYLAVYVNNPTNALWLTADMAGNYREFIIVPESTYTFPTSFGGKTVAKWTDGAAFFAAGDSFAIADVAGKTFYPYDKNIYYASPAAYDESLGQLIYFTNFDPEDDGSANLVSLTAKDAAAGKVFSNIYGALGTDPLGTSTGILLISSEGESNAWKYADGTPVSGTVMLKSRVASDETGRTVWDMHDTPVGDSLFGYYSYWKGASVTSEWKDTAFNPITATSLKTVGYKSNAWNAKVYYSYFAVYVKPDNAIWLTDANGENRTFTTAGGTTYTFPTTIGSENVQVWTNGTLAFAAGETVSLDDVTDFFGTTFKAVSDAPTTVLRTSIRTEDIPGLRFAAYVTDAQREASSSYGFLVARENEELRTAPSHLVFNDTNSASATNIYGVKYTSGVAYDKAADIDKVYSEDGAPFGKPEIEATFFTGVMYGIPKAYYRENLVARPYMIVNGITLYGDTYASNLYDNAYAIREGGYEGLDDDGIAYIDSILAEDEVDIDIDKLLN